MVKQDLIHTVQDEEDRRCVHLVLTEQAIEIIAQATELRNQMYNMILEGVTEEERKVLFQVSQKVNQNIRNALRNS